MDKISDCPQCHSPHVYPLDNMLICPECGYEWAKDSQISEKADNSVDEYVDANGNPLQDGDSVIVIKDLPVKGAPKPVKSGTKVKSIRLIEGDHDIVCKIDGFGTMYLKSEFVKKA